MRGAMPMAMMQPHRCCWHLSVVLPVAPCCPVPTATRADGSWGTPGSLGWYEMGRLVALPAGGGMELHDP